MIESNYEGESIKGYTTTPFYIRKQNYWTMLAGGCGITYMNGYYAFGAGWADHLSDTGATQIIHLNNLLGAYDWQLLVPDTTNTVLTAGYGTYTNGEDGGINTNDYAPCAYVGTLGGSLTLAMIYMPTNRTMTVDMSEFSGSVTCRWYDPTSGQYENDAASPHANSGTHDFSHSGANDASETDWVLVLDLA